MAPVLFFVHGGAWKSGDKSDYRELGNTFAGTHGFVTVVVNYRLSPEVKHPAHVQDVAGAFAWTYKKISKYGGDPQRITIFGHSAGGHLVSLLAADASYLKAHRISTGKIRGGVSMSGRYDLAGLPRFFAPVLYTAFGASDKAALRAASPVRAPSKSRANHRFHRFFAQIPPMASRGRWHSL